ncbi:HRDC-like protein [Gaertneriomyces semiglobifer]|nr:HRDC-like protein [Gaertneriomyces semiglobifer]
MEVLQLRDSHLPNAELFWFLNEVQQQLLASETGFTDTKLQPLAEIEQEVRQYLGETPASAQTPEQLQQFKQLIQPYGLMKAEELNILNIRPKNLSELWPLIEQCERRLTEEQQAELVAKITELLPYTEPVPAAEGEADAMEVA